MHYRVRYSLDFDPKIRSGQVWSKVQVLLHCKCLQGFTGTLQGNECTGVSNLQGLQVTCNACKNFLQKTLKGAGDMFYREAVGKTLYNL